MTLPDQNVQTKRDPRQMILRKKMNTHLDAVAKSRPTSVQMRYAQSIATSGDWSIKEQPARELPLELTQYIKVETRDFGNALIEETRELNNRYAGSSYRNVEAELAGDLVCLGLRQRILEWCEDVAAQVNYKLRHRAKDAPFATFDHAYRTIVSPLDTGLIHAKDRLYMFVWSSVVDMLPFKLWEAMISAPGHVRIEHDAGVHHLPNLIASASVRSKFDKEAISELLGLYGIEADAYLHNVIIEPMLEMLERETEGSPHEHQRARYDLMVADILEAAPYLLASDRSERFMIELPGSGCVAAFQFIAGSSCAQIAFADNMDSLRSGLRTTLFRAALNIGYDGRISTYMHPWRTLESVYGEQRGQRIACWMLEQVHARITADYLKIEKYFLHVDEPVQVDDGEIACVDETLAYVLFAKTAPGNQLAEQGDASLESAVLEEPRSVLPQLRQRYFFKLLERCGVRIEQGKGSEIKLLRDGGRPFRLGNHYGINPTIPTFLANQILKRLEITRDEWLDALATW